MKTLECTFWRHFQMQTTGQNLWLFDLVDQNARVLQGFVREVKPFWSKLFTASPDKLVKLEMGETWSSKTKECRVPIITKALGADVSRRSVLIHLGNTMSKTITVANSENCICVVYVNPTAKDTTDLVTITKSMIRSSDRFTVPNLACDYPELVSGFPTDRWELVISNQS